MLRLKSLVIVSAALLQGVAFAQSAPRAVLNELEWRNLGPYRGGRSVAVSGVPGRPDEFYFGAAAGGVWKSTDAGASWSNVSDGFFGTASVGAIGVSKSNPDRVYVGMGETEIRGNINHGDGVYRTDDGGKTWRNIGLKETQSISRVRVSPSDPDTVWVAALGHIYGPDKNRGVYKTTDGGKTWKKTLFVSDKAGAEDITFADSDPSVMYASTWEASRTAYGMTSGGPGSKMFKSTDGGDTWKEISDNPGLPKGFKGKICMAVAPSKPDRVYAMVESVAGGLYRSDDAGAHWELMSDSSEIKQRPFYYFRTYVNPKDADDVTVLNVSINRSSDGGKTFRRFNARHSDNHDLWFNPDNPDRMIEANDGGATVSIDGGKSWSAQDQPTGQIYHVNVDNAYPYNILGAQQDNSTIRMASRTRGAGITRDDWTSTAGAESGYVTPNPADPDLVFGGNYGGSLSWQNHRTQLGRDVDPWPDNPMGHGAIDLVQRFQWTFPIVYSPFDPNCLYVGSQYVLKSTNAGQSWTKISPDLTTNDKSRQVSSGGPITKDNTSVEYYCTVFTIAESPVKKGVIWAGTDDGRIHVTMNGGKSWNDVTPKAMPKFSRVQMISCSAFEAGVAYAAVDNHEADDYKPYAYKTSDFGKTWTAIVGGLPSDAYLHVVREDPARRGLLYAGLSNGVYVSYNDGASWQSLACKNFPVVPVSDLQIKEGDLVISTYGRGFWVLDDLAIVRQGDKVDAGKPYIFTPTPSEFTRWGRDGGPTDGPNPLVSGPVVRIWSPSEGGKVEVNVFDKEGTKLSTLTENSLEKGITTVQLRSMQYPSFDSYPGLLMWGAGRRPISAPPGHYTCKVTVDDKPLGEVDAHILNDPRSDATEAEMYDKYKLSIAIRDATSDCNNAVLKIRSMREELQKVPNDGSKTASRTQELLKRLEDIDQQLTQGLAQSGQDFLNYPIRLNNRLAALLGQLQGNPFPATKQSFDVFAILKKELDVQLAKLKAIEKETGMEDKPVKKSA